MNKLDLSDVRQDFQQHEALEESALHPDPYQQFALWFEEALASGMPEPNAMVLASVNAQGQPSQRTVLLKYFDADGWVFFTHYGSQKALDMAQNPQVCLHFPWYALQRQVKIIGRAEKISHAQSLRYFLSRPRDSQLGAWASPQSQVIDSRQFLLQQWQKMKTRFAAGEVPLPDFWGGYRVRASSIEFWQGQPNRLHDRFHYFLEQHQWHKVRLAP